MKLSLRSRCSARSSALGASARIFSGLRSRWPRCMSETHSDDVSPPPKPELSIVVDVLCRLRSANSALSSSRPGMLTRCASTRSFASPVVVTKRFVLRASAPSDALRGQMPWRRFVSTDFCTLATSASTNFCICWFQKSSGAQPAMCVAGSMIAASNGMVEGEPVEAQLGLTLSSPLGAYKEALKGRACDSWGKQRFLT